MVEETLDYQKAKDREEESSSVTQEFLINLGN